MLFNIFLVGAGGFIGSVARYLVYLSVGSQTSSFPIGTLLVNVVGCFCIGVASTFAERQTPTHAPLLLLLSTGLIGGFTTFSAFSLETVVLVKDQQFMFVVLNILLNLTLGFGAVWAGRWVS